MLDVEWKNVRASQLYPLLQECTPISKENKLLPNSFILDISIQFPLSYDTSNYNFYISEIKETEDSFILILSSHTEDSDQKCLQSFISKTCQIQSKDSQSCFPFINIYEGSDEALKLISGNCIIGISKNLSLGNICFLPENTKIHSACYHSMQISALQAIKVGEKTLTGIVELIGDEGIIIQADQISNCITIQIDQDYINDKIKQHNQRIENIYKTPIKSINNVLPDSTGNINIQGLDCVSIEHVNPQKIGALIISNPCGKPCCDVSSDTQQIQNAINSIKDQMNRLKQYYQNQAIVLNFMQTHLSTLLAQGTN